MIEVMASRSFRGVRNGDTPLLVDVEVEHAPIAALDLRAKALGRTEIVHLSVSYLAIPADVEGDGVPADAVQRHRRL